MNCALLHSLKHTSIARCHLSTYTNSAIPIPNIFAAEVACVIAEGTAL
ncbi:hypothetical protein FDUTEX481_10018 [Tolypothrix sp. PCC 7601]|nr:hypothetical protein FDUTEX481_10018 [Tolypothrix sp. PCC 7601]